MIELATELRVFALSGSLNQRPKYCPSAHAKPLCSFERSWLFVCWCIDSNQLITNKGANKLLYKLINNTLEHSWLIDCAWTIRAPLGTWTSHQAKPTTPTHTQLRKHSFIHSWRLEICSTCVVDNLLTLFAEQTEWTMHGHAHTLSCSNTGRENARVHTFGHKAKIGF